MSEMLSIGFIYKKKDYHALVRIKEKPAVVEYHLTVMNGNLEKLLYGCHVFTDENGSLSPKKLSVDADVCLLQDVLLATLKDHRASGLFMNSSRQETGNNA